jgi:branched-chain amino acid transport system substrate-binding protein
MATISMDYAFGWESNGGFQRVFEDLGGKVVQRIWTPLNAQDYAPYLAALKKDIDGVYACHTGGLSPRFLKAWSDAGLKGRIPLVGIGTLTDENILKGMGDEAVGVITSLIYSAALDSPPNKKFAASYEKRYNRTTSLYSAEGYTGARFYYEALKAVNGDVEDKEKFLAALRKVEISDDARGPLRMDDLGNPIQNVYIRKVERVDVQQGRILEAAALRPQQPALQVLRVGYERGVRPWRAGARTPARAATRRPSLSRTPSACGRRSCAGRRGRPSRRA